MLVGKTLSAGILALTIAGAAMAQSTVPLQGLKADTTAPVQIEADSLSVSQSDGSALFKGHVLIAQATMRLSADEVKVDYAPGQNGARGEITRLTATGNVTLASDSEAAEAQEAVYEVAKGEVTMKGSVLLTQGPNVISGETLVVSLKDGTGTMSGRVRTVIDPKGGQGGN